MLNEGFSYDPALLNDYRLSLIVGEPTSLFGQTRVVLDGTGTLHAELRRSTQEPINAQGSLPDPQAVFSQLASFDWQQPFPSRMGIPDEAISVWTVEVQGQAVHTLRMWLRDAEKDERVAPILTALRVAVNELSNQRIYI